MGRKIVVNESQPRPKDGSGGGGGFKKRSFGGDSGDGCVKPSKETIQDGSYKPLARPIFMYPSSKSLAKPEVKAFMDFTIKNAAKIADAAKIVPMTPEQITTSTEAVKAAESAAGA